MPQIHLQLVVHRPEIPEQRPFVPLWLAVPFGLYLLSATVAAVVVAGSLLQIAIGL